MHWPEILKALLEVCSFVIMKSILSTAEAIHELFFEVLIAPSFTHEALDMLKTKKNRILLQLIKSACRSSGEKIPAQWCPGSGVLIREIIEKWDEVGGRNSTDAEKQDLIFGNLVCKHLKSNAIALVKNKQLIGKGCGQTSRIDSLRQAIEKANQFKFNLKGAALASDAFFPFR